MSTSQPDVGGDIESQVATDAYAIYELSVGESTVRCREHHREPLAVVDVFAPVGAHRLPFELLLVSTFTEMGY